MSRASSDIFRNNPVVTIPLLQGGAPCRLILESPRLRLARASGSEASADRLELLEEPVAAVVAVEQCGTPHPSVLSIQADPVVIIERQQVVDVALFQCLVVKHKCLLVSVVKLIQ